MTSLPLTNGSRTPLRYPGGKGKITRYVAHLLDINGINGTYIEPFAGGAGVAINLLLAGRVKRIVINDLDHGVSAFWHTLTHEKSSLVSAIKQVPFDTHTSLDDFTAEERFQYWRSIHDRYIQDQDRPMESIAFDFFMLNRMNVSGIVKGGPIGGYSQNGKYNIGSRFNKDELIQRIETIAAHSDSIMVRNDEGSHFCARLFGGEIPNLWRDNTFMFVDPPYYKQGRNLYNSYATDKIHDLVAQELKEHGLNWKWIVTYDDEPFIRRTYDCEQLQKYKYDITYSANKRGKFKELLYSPKGTKIESYDNVRLEPLDAISYT